MSKDMVGRYMKDGKVAVIYSPGFGSGWSQSNTESCWFGENDPPSQEELLFDPTLARMIDEGADVYAMEEYASKRWGEYGNWLGLGDAKLAWLEPGTQFVVWEYDGAESIKLASELVVVA